MDNKQTESVFEQIRESLNLRLVILGLGSFLILQSLGGINIFEQVNLKIPQEIGIFTPLIYLMLLGVLGALISIILNMNYNTIKWILLKIFTKKYFNKIFIDYKYKQLINLYEKGEKKKFSIDRKDIKNHYIFYVDDYFIVYLKGKNYNLYKSYIREVSVLILARDLLSVFGCLLSWQQISIYYQDMTNLILWGILFIASYLVIFILYGFVDIIINKKLLQHIDYITTEETTNV